MVILALHASHVLSGIGIVYMLMRLQHKLLQLVISSPSL